MKRDREKRDLEVFTRSSMSLEKGESGSHKCLEKINSREKQKGRWLQGFIVNKKTVLFLSKQNISSLEITSQFSVKLFNFFIQPPFLSHS